LSIANAACRTRLLSRYLQRARDYKGPFCRGCTFPAASGFQRSNQATVKFNFGHQGLKRAITDTPILKLEAALKCRLCKKGHYAPPVHMIELAATQEITPSNCPLAKKNPGSFLPGFRLESCQTIGIRSCAARGRSTIRCPGPCTGKPQSASEPKASAPQYRRSSGRGGTTSLLPRTSGS
jgi:hypothetical protein